MLNQLEEAKSVLNIEDVILTSDDFEIFNGEKRPKYFGGYGSKSKYEIREVEL